MYFFSPNGAADGPYVGAGRNGNGDFWTRTLGSDTGVLQLRCGGKAARGARQRISFVVSELGHIYDRQHLAPGVGGVADTWPCADNVACLVDANCVSGTPADPAKDSHAKMEWIISPYIYTCTGGLLVDTVPATQIPYFLTANHCTSTSISNMETWFNYTTDSCNGTCPGSLVHGGTIPPSDTIGFTVVASNATSDFTLGTLDEAPPAGAVFLGWNTSPVAFTNGADLYRISNANFGPQVYSQQDIDTSSPTCGDLPRGNIIYSKNNTGSTMGGSSGSPVVNSASEVVGQLYGCCGYNCANDCDFANNWTIDGAFAVTWPYVEQYLDPGGCTGDPECDDGLYCNGAEWCDIPSGDCQPGTAPNCNDGVVCTDDSCNEGTDSCDNLANDANCPDDGLFCNGTEFCDAVADCSSTGDPCAPLGCDEILDQCAGGPTAQLEAGSVTVGASPVTVNLANTYISPVIVCTLQYDNNTIPAVTRVTSVTATSFDVYLQNPGDLATPVADNVSYLVVEEGTWTIDGVNVEAQTYLSTVTDENNSWIGEAQTYGQSYTNPVVVGQVMSVNDPDWSVFRCRGNAQTNPPSSTVLFTGKHVAEDPVVPRADETVAFIVFESGHSTIGGVAFEAVLGTDTILGVDDAPPYTYTFNTAFATAPAIGVVNIGGMDGGNGGWGQIHGPTLATTTTLYLSIDEDQINDPERNRTTDQIEYVVFESAVAHPPVAECTIPEDCDDGAYCNGVEDCVDGICVSGTAVGCTDDSCNEGTDSCDNIANDAYCPDDFLFCNGTEYCDAVADCSSTGDPCLPGEICNEETDTCDPGDLAKLESGTVFVGSTGVTVNLINTYTSPVVVCSVNYSNNNTPIVTRVGNVTASSFDVRLQGAPGTPVSDTVYYLVVEEGSWTIDGVNIDAQTYTSTVTDEDNSWVGQAQSYGQSYSNPVVVGQVMSENDPNWSVFWDQGSSRGAPPSATALRTGKTVCEDTLVARANETVGFIVFEAGHGTIGGIEFEAALGADTIRGVTNVPPYTYTFNMAFGATPQIAIVTMAAVDGGNGGWAYTYGAAPLSATAIDLVIDEDQIGDTERNHTTEQVGYIVFESAAVYP